VSDKYRVCEIKSIYPPVPINDKVVTFPYLGDQVIPSVVLGLVCRLSHNFLFNPMLLAVTLLGRFLLKLQDFCLCLPMPNLADRDE